MQRARPCRICQKWFRPDPRVGSRQRVCGSVACQRERHRRACKAWHKRNPGYDREARLQRRLHRLSGSAAASTAAPVVSPMARLDWAAVRDAVGLEVTVVVEESVKVLCGWVRDAVIAQPLAAKRVRARHVPVGTRDEIATRPP